MTDRICAFTVTLEDIIRADDAEAIRQAILALRGVAQVVPVVADAATHWARETARRELLDSILSMLEAPHD
jgi:hypothetical protein